MLFTSPSLANLAGNQNFGGLPFLNVTGLPLSTSLSHPLQPSDRFVGASSAIALNTDFNPSPSSVQNINILNGRWTTNGAVNRSNDPWDLVEFQLTTRSTLDIQLSGLSADADIFLTQDLNGSGSWDSPDEVIAYSTNSGINSEFLRLRGLEAGTYQMWVGINTNPSLATSTNYALALTSDTAGNELSTARNLGTLTSGSTFTQRDFVDSNDLDVYQFRLNQTSSLSLSLTGLTSDADLYLIQDGNANGIVETNEILRYAISPGVASESINLTGLAAGRYYIQIVPYSDSNTNYTFSVSTNSTEPGGTLATAVEVGALAGQRSFTGSVSSTDVRDIYRFELNATSNLQVDLSGLTSDTDLYLIQDSNGNGLIDGNEYIGRSFLGTTSERINSLNLAIGTYFVMVERFAGATNYTLSLTSDQSGDTFSSARNLGSLSGSRSISDFVSSLSSNYDYYDYYRFTLDTISNLNLALRGITAEADLYLYRADGTQIGSSIDWFPKLDSITLSNLSAGNYYIRVNSWSTTNTTNYILDLTAQAVSGLQTLAGTLEADRFTVSPNVIQTVISGNGNVDFMIGQRDIIDLSNILSSSVSINLASLSNSGVAYNPGNGTRMFDAINFSNGRRILFEGIDQLVFADRTINLSTIPNDPLFKQQWNLNMMGVHNAWRFTTGSSQVMVGVEDSGLALNAQGYIPPDLNAIWYNTSNGYGDDFFNANLNQGSSFSHGTAVQSIIAASSNNGSGMSGINWNSDFYVVDVLGGSLGDFSLADATTTMANFAASRNQRLVINMSLGWSNSFSQVGINPSFEAAVAANPNVLFVIAAGNDGDLGISGLSYPATLANRYSNMMSVGASWGRTDDFGNSRTPGTRIEYSNWWGSQYGNGLTLMAPSEVLAIAGTRSLSGSVSYDYDPRFNGTSAAAPNVTGVASLVWSANPNLTATQVRQIMSQTATDLGSVGYDSYYGNGLVNADAAVRRAIAIGAGYA
jgi:serine protease